MSALTVLAIIVIASTANGNSCERAVSQYVAETMDHVFRGECVDLNADGAPDIIALEEWEDGTDLGVLVAKSGNYFSAGRIADVQSQYRIVRDRSLPQIEVDDADDTEPGMVHRCRYQIVHGSLSRMSCAAKRPAE